MKEQTKANDKIKTPITFEWTDEKVAEVYSIIAREYKDSKTWSGDSTIELNIIKKYKFDKTIHEKIKCLNIINVGNEDIVMVDYIKLQNLIQYLSRYQADLQGL